MEMNVAGVKMEEDNVTMIQSFIFFGVETTSLPKGLSLPKLTEIALLAVSRMSLCQSKGVPPEFTQELVIPVNPSVKIPAMVSLLTGLFNNELEGVPPFNDNTYTLLMKFINSLVPPVCFVAHNGSQIQYPILLHEAESIGKTLPEDILAIDTLNVFKHYFDKNSAASGSSLYMDFASAALESTDSASDKQHTAEGDCLRIIKCLSQFADIFVAWADRNAVPITMFRKKD
ncbi:three prime repair exonuclease 2 [Orussus abietinus]|uniref:three prime repair exonuclease 2 n=1 Tax=Orussus abietinus TaxID=222816 RepID=UPI0006257AEC|nr:three prime repair exonuclease 2 [Orussus abietinus]